MNKVLENFYVEVRTNKGDDYEPDSLKVMLGALDRHLKNVNYPVSIIRGIEFASSKQVLEGKCRKLREAGLGKKRIKLTHYHNRRKKYYGNADS